MEQDLFTAENATRRKTQEGIESILCKRLFSDDYRKVLLFFIFKFSLIYFNQESYSYTKIFLIHTPILIHDSNYSRLKK